MTAQRTTWLAAACLCAAVGCRFDGSGARFVERRDAPAIALDRGERPDRTDRPRREKAASESDCLDRIDEDDDGKVDCEDPDCAAGYQCVPAAAGPFVDYYQLQETAWGAGATPCADGNAPQILPSRPVPGACSPCSCGPLQGATCGYPIIHTWTGGAGDCASGTEADATPTLGKSGCVGGKVSGGQVALKVVGPGPLISPGSCTASGGVASNPPPFTHQLEACALRTGGGCGASAVCVPRPPDGGVTRLCHRSGSGTCGAGSTTLVGHESWKDGRTCTSCVCTPGGTTCSGGKYVLYGNNQSCDSSGCNDPETIAPGGSCRPFKVDRTASYSVKAEPASPSGGACVASGGQPVGGIISTPVTFCCAP